MDRTSRRPPNGGRRHPRIRQAALAASLVVGGLFVLAVTTGVLGRVYDRLGFGVRDVVLTLALTLVGVIAVLAALGWSRAKKEAGRRERAEGRYRNLVEQLPAYVFIEEPGTHRNLYVSPQIEEMLGFTPDRWKADPDLWAIQLHPDDRERVLGEIESAAAKGAWSTEYRTLTRDGQTRWVHKKSLLVRGAQGTDPYWQGVVFDITERRSAEEKLRAVEAQLRNLVEQLPGYVFIEDPDDRSNLYVSPQIEQMLGFTPEEWKADPDLWEAQLHPADLDRVVQARWAADAVGAWEVDYRTFTRDGRILWLHKVANVVRDMDGVAPYWQGIVFDITERKHAEEVILQSERHEREAAERLRALDQMKNSFLTAVSHELRRPLTTILGMALTLERQEAFVDERADLWNRLTTSARKLDRLLRDLLDVDRLSRGVSVFNPSETDLGALTRTCVESMDAGARTVVLEETPVAIQVDAAKVERIVEDLVTNALRQTGPNARIWVRVLLEGDGGVIAVEDDGPGVPLEERESIFESFRGPELSGHSPGAGIGLSLVKMFAEMHGGRAWVQDRDGGGASFRVFLPFALLDSVPLSAEHAHPAPVVEDVSA